jgi:hypothetical protein
MNIHHATALVLVSLLAGCFTPTALKTVTACNGGDQSACDNMSRAGLESSQHCADGDAAACRDYLAAKLQVEYVACQQGNKQACDAHDKTVAAMRNAAELSALKPPPPTPMQGPTHTHCYQIGDFFNCDTY